jgi:hypothetical protein
VRSVVYKVRVTNPDGSKSSFDFTAGEPLRTGDFINPGTMVYKVVRILPDESVQYDAVIEAEWAAGPAGAGFTR